MRVVADGSEHPERIPDRVAIGMFMWAIAIPANADAKAVRSMEAKVAPMGLGRADMNVLRAELAGLHARFQVQRDAIVLARADAQGARTPAAAARLTAAVEARDALAMESYARLLETLSPAGARQLATHLARVKTQMKALSPAR
jgi:putative heme iron utilization protein